MDFLPHFSTDLLSVSAFFQGNSHSYSLLFRQPSVFDIDITVVCISHKLTPSAFKHFIKLSLIYVAEQRRQILLLSYLLSHLSLLRFLSIFRLDLLLVRPLFAL